MPQLLAPMVEEFHLTVKSAYKARCVKKNDPIVVKFKQATEALNIERQGLLSRPITRWWDRSADETESQYREQYNISTLGHRMAVDVFLTLTFCNVLDLDGEPLFQGKEKSFDDFVQKWGQLYPEWAEAIYEQACVKVNPTWAGGEPEEDQDEENMTVGEDAAAEAASEPA